MFTQRTTAFLEEAIKMIKYAQAGEEVHPQDEIRLDEAIMIIEKFL